jgi:hypothetical protein
MPLQLRLDSLPLGSQRIVDMRRREGRRNPAGECDGVSPILVRPRRPTETGPRARGVPGDDLGIATGTRTSRLRAEQTTASIRDPNLGKAFGALPRPALIAPDLRKQCSLVVVNWHCFATSRGPFAAQNPSAGSPLTGQSTPRERAAVLSFITMRPPRSGAAGVVTALERLQLRHPSRRRPRLGARDPPGLGQKARSRAACF